MNDLVGPYFISDYKPRIFLRPDFYDFLLSTKYAEQVSIEEPGRRLPPFLQQLFSQRGESVRLYMDSDLMADTPRTETQIN